MTKTQTNKTKDIVIYWSDANYPQYKNWVPVEALAELQQQHEEEKLDTLAKCLELSKKVTNLTEENQQLKAKIKEMGK